jgi:hypothetical protein
VTNRCIIYLASDRRQLRISSSAAAISARIASAIARRTSATASASSYGKRERHYQAQNEG